ncbi:hypothetical protein BCR32DRAFT_211396, partial [Anaeromyces robustus]
IDFRFFVSLCQSLNIPVITESDEEIKECGFRNPEYIEKLSILKKITSTKAVNIIYIIY